MHPNPIVIGILCDTHLINPDDFISCELIEIRFDLIPEALNSVDTLNSTLSHIRSLFPTHALMGTIRLERDGGKWPVEASKDRIKFFQAMIRTGELDWIDIELEEIALMELHPECLEHNTQILCSHHNFKQSYHAEELTALTQEIQLSGANAAKFALTFKGAGDAQELYRFLHERTDHYVFAAFSMGDLGRESRLLAPLLGASGTYGYTGDTAAAPGQITTQAMTQFFKSIHLHSYLEGVNMNRELLSQHVQVLAQQFLQDLDSHTEDLT